MQQVTIPWLKSIEALNPVPDEQLQWLIDNSDHQELNEGDYIFKRDMPLDGTIFIVAGRIRIYLMRNGVRSELVSMHERQVTGFLPYSRAKVAIGDGIAVETTQIMMLPREKCPELIRDFYELTQALVSLMSDRVRDSTAIIQQNEKMMALGKLSAGLAHELNNPASSIVRNAALLKQHLKAQPQLFAKLLAVNLDADKVAAVKAEMTRILDSKKDDRLTLRERSRLEGELLDWFEEHEIDDSDEMAENFVEQGFNSADLDAIYRHVTPEAAAPVFRWINDNLLSEKMVADIHHASERIADLITSIKTFTHMDRGQDRQYATVDTGIRNTLNMLGHKIRANNITVVQEYDPELPLVKMLVGELNQVWTNLIDNAIDAMSANSKGTLSIHTRKDREFAEIIIADDGPGIAGDIRSRIFDPFFTTKEMGKGTGMGLEVVQRIIKQQHQGSVKVNSEPGKTEFIVCIPIESC
ncbi:ATP-binding protein [Mucilaginibacter sp. PAMB04168]|uniref:sensor histidine kinase n=1 Tax=Mucilaginibacter sp. PAMB04168 TaxID=3138567 RepID=UPI0031F6515B